MTVDGTNDKAVGDALGTCESNEGVTEGTKELWASEGGTLGTLETNEGATEGTLEAIEGVPDRMEGDTLGTFEAIVGNIVLTGTVGAVLIGGVGNAVGACVVGATVCPKNDGRPVPVPA